MSSKFEMGKSNKMDFWLVIIILALLGMGTMMVFSSSSAASYVKMQSSYHLLTRQLLWVGVGLIVMIIVSQLDYHIFVHWGVVIFGIAFVLLILVLIPGVGTTLNHATRWLGPSAISFQPSEVMKLGMILLFSSFFRNDFAAARSATIKGFVKCMTVILAVAGLLYLEPHISCAIIISGTAVVLMYVGGTKIKHFAITFGLLGAGALVAFFTLNHVKERVLTFLDPFKYASDEGYQIVQSLLAIGSGGLTGKGLGQSVQKYLYLPEPYNDFIFSILAEELGFIGCAVVIALFALFLFRGYKIAIHAYDKAGQLVATGITTMIAIQVIMNLAVVTSSMPVTGVSLPFFSYGGSALVIMMANMGILLNISKRSKYDKF